MPVFARLGPYRAGARSARPRMSPAPAGRELFEYWAHEASLVPIDAAAAACAWRMDRADRERVERQGPRMASDVRTWSTRCTSWSRRQGPIGARPTRGIARPDPRPAHMWNWHDGKVALEYLFGPAGHRRAPGQLRAATTTCPSGCCRSEVSRRRPRRSRTRPARARPDRGPGLRRRHRARSAATTSGCRGPSPEPAVAELVDAGRAVAGARSTAGGTRPTCGRRPGCPRRIRARALLSPVRLR